MTPGDVEDRAERLRILLSVSESAGRPGEAMRLLSADDLDALADLDPEDLALANACYAVQADLRARGFAAVAELGRLIGHSPEPRGELGERVLALPEPDLFAAIRHILDLGWVDSPPSQPPKEH